VSEVESREMIAPNLSGEKSLEGLKMLKLGKFKIIPNLLFKSSIDTNALYADAGSRTDYLFDIIPGLDIAARGSRLDFMAGYKFVVHQNVKFDVQDYFGHDFRTELFTNPFNKRVFFRLHDDLSDTHDPADLEILDDTRIFSNDAEVELGYLTPGEDMQFAVSYVNTYKKYNDIFDGSSMLGNGIQFRSKVNLSSKYRFLPKTQAVFDFSYTRAKQEYSDDYLGGIVHSHAYRFSGGIVGAFTRRLSLTARAGYNRINFDINETASDLVAEFILNYYFSRKLKLSAGYARKVDYSVYSPYSSINNFTFSANYNFHRKWMIDLKYELDDINFSGPVSSGSGGTRSDFVNRVRVEINYKLKKWLNALVGYRLEARRSNLVGIIRGTGTADFTRNVFYVGVGFNYF